jgi:CBS-domain-containing membrane protein
MLETTSSIDLFIPQMVAIVTARAVAKMFTRGLYDRALRTKQIPLLRSNLPAETECLPVKDFMTCEVTTIPSVTDMASIRACFATTHEAWPVMNTAGNMVGRIPKSVLVKLIKFKAFYTQK